MSLTLQTDASGNIVTYPVTGWELRSVANMSIMVVIEYIESPEQLETGERKQLQTILSAPQALDFAETMKKAATVLLALTFQTTVH